MALYTYVLLLSENNTVSTAKQKNKPRPFIDLIFSLVIPTVILLKLSDEELLGPTIALIVALSFPVVYGIHDLLVNNNRNFMAILGVISVLLTGGIGLLKLDNQWIAVKEAAIPLCIGVGVFVANKLGYPLIRKLLLNPTVMNTDRIYDELDKKNTRQEFESRLNRANNFLVGTFVISAALNYFLAKLVVTSDSGTAAFNKELARMQALSYPIIALPSLIMMMAIFWFIWRTVNRLTGLSLEEIIVNGEDEKSP